MAKDIPGSGQTYWSESDVEDGKWVVLPTMRVARLHHVTDCGRKVFITPAGKLICEHGECASSIGSWVSAEQAAQRVGEQPFSRNGICDCQNTDGMHWSLPLLGPWKRRAATPGGTLPLKRMLEPEPPTKFYKENYL